MTHRTIACKACRSRMAWLLSLALCLAALLPSLGMLLRSAAPDLVNIEICSAQGNRVILVAANDVPEPALPEHGSAAPHCPLCITPAGTDVLPSADTTHVPVWNGVAVSLVASATNPFLPSVSSGRHLARAPPFFA